MVEKEGHLYLVHIFNLLDDEVVIWMPVLRIFLQVPEVSKYNNNSLSIGYIYLTKFAVNIVISEIFGSLKQFGRIK